MASYRGTYEREELKIARSLVREGDTVVDVGANIGLFTTALLSEVGAIGKVIAVEPSPYCLRLLKQVVGAACASNVTIHPIAVGPEAGTAILKGHDYPGNAGVGSLRKGIDGYAGVPVRVRRLDDLLDESGAEEVTFLKIDIEGYEPDVLDSMSWLHEGRVHYVMVEVSPEFGTATSFAAVQADIESLYSGFAVEASGYFAYRPRLRCISAQTVAESERQFNMLLVRRDKRAVLGQWCL